MGSKSRNVNLLERVPMFNDQRQFYKEVIIELYKNFDVSFDAI